MKYQSGVAVALAFANIGLISGAVANETPKLGAVNSIQIAAKLEPAWPIGALAKCNDGTYSYAKTRRGACSRHRGVAYWK